MSISEDHDGWDLRESGPPDTDHTELLLAGAQGLLDSRREGMSVYYRARPRSKT